MISFPQQIINLYSDHSATPNAYCLINESEDKLEVNINESYSFRGRNFSRKFREAFPDVTLSPQEAELFNWGSDEIPVNSIVTDQIRLWQAVFVAEKHLKKQLQQAASQVPYTEQTPVTEIETGIDPVTDAEAIAIALEGEDIEIAQALQMEAEGRNQALDKPKLAQLDENIVHQDLPQQDLPQQDLPQQDLPQQDLPQAELPLVATPNLTIFNNSNALKLPNLQQQIQSLLKLQRTAQQQLTPINDVDPRYLLFLQEQEVDKGKPFQLVETIGLYPTLRNYCVHQELPITKVNICDTGKNISTSIFLGKTPENDEFKNYLDMLFQQQPKMLVCADSRLSDFLKPNSSISIPIGTSVASKLLLEMDSSGVLIQLYKLKIDRENQDEKDQSLELSLIHIHCADEQLKDLSPLAKISSLLALTELVYQLMKEHQLSVDNAVFQSSQGVGYNSLLAVLLTMMDKGIGLEELLSTLLFARNHHFFGGISPKVLHNKEVLMLLAAADQLLKNKVIDVGLIKASMTNNLKSLRRTVNSLLSFYTVPKVPLLPYIKLDPKLDIDLCRGGVCPSPDIRHCYLGNESLCYLGEHQQNNNLSTYLNCLMEIKPSVIVMTGSQYCHYFAIGKKSSRAGGWEIDVAARPSQSRVANGIEVYRVNIHKNFAQTDKDLVATQPLTHSFNLIITGSLVTHWTLLNRHTGLNRTTAKMVGILNLVDEFRGDGKPLFQSDHHSMDNVLLATALGVTAHYPIDQVMSSLISLTPDQFIQLSNTPSVMNQDCFNRVLLSWMRQSGEKYEMQKGQPNNLQTAITKDNKTDFEQLIRLKHVNLIEQTEAQSALMRAAESPNPSYLKSLLMLIGVDVVQLTDEEYEDIQSLAKDNNWHAIMTRYANLNATQLAYYVDKKGNTQLHWLVMQGSSDRLINYLELDDVPINQKNNKGNSPLHLAIDHKNWPVVQALLKDTRTDITSKNSKGLRVGALLQAHQAERSTGVDTCIELLESRVDYQYGPETADCLNLTGFDLSRYFPRPRSIQGLRGGKYSTKSVVMRGKDLRVESKQVIEKKATSFSKITSQSKRTIGLSKESFENEEIINIFKNINMTDLEPTIKYKLLSSCNDINISLSKIYDGEFKGVEVTELQNSILFLRDISLSIGEFTDAFGDNILSVLLNYNIGFYKMKQLIDSSQRCILMLNELDSDELNKVISEIKTLVKLIEKTIN